MLAYKCDICGKYTDNGYGVKGRMFEINPKDSILGIKIENNNPIEMEHLCENCHQDIRDYILKKYAEHHKEQE